MKKTLLMIVTFFLGGLFLKAEIQITSNSYPPLMNLIEDTILLEIYSFPAPDEIMSYVIQQQLDHHGEFLSDTDITNKYLTDNEQTILVGIYLADMAYCLTTDEHSKGLKYLNTINEIAKKMSLFPYLETNIKDRIISNLGSIDTLKAISNEMHDLTLDYLLDTERIDTYIYITAGGIIESLYILLNSYEIKESNNIISQRIAEQKAIIDNMNEMINYYLDSYQLKTLKNNIQPIVNIYSSIIDINSNNRVHQQNDLLIIGSDSKNQIDVEQIIHLRKEVNTLRNKWIKNE